MAISLRLAELQAYLISQGERVDLCDRQGNVFRTEYAIREPEISYMQRPIANLGDSICQPRTKHHSKSARAARTI